MNVLFVCSGNAYRSPVAEALLKKFRPDINVDSAGTHPVIPISEEAVRYLERENAESFLKETPEPLDDKLLDEYQLIVAMKPRHKEVILSRRPGCRDKVVVWDIDDPYFLPQGYEESVFHKIKDKVLELVESL
ncbi:MAG: low molecular weight phosphatase family protein [Thermoproteota archaeon]